MSDKDPNIDDRDIDLKKLLENLDNPIRKKQAQDRVKEFLSKRASTEHIPGAHKHMNEIEHHPYAPFIPENATVLILGSFPGIRQTRNPDPVNEWFYSAGRNQFWKIIQAVYSVELNDVIEKKALFQRLGIAVTDIVLSARRDNSQDKDLKEIVYNKDAISLIIDKPEIKTVFFTSQFVQKHFLSLFPTYTAGECLPSPSPIFRRMSLQDKIDFYKQKLPSL